MCAAHWEALQGLMDSAECVALEGGELQPSILVEHLSALAVHGPPALAISPGLQDMLSRAASMLQQVAKSVRSWCLRSLLPLQQHGHAFLLSWDAIGLAF